MTFINTNLRHVGTVGSGGGCTFPGAERGYVCGGFLGKTGTAPNWNAAVYGRQIEKISFTTDGNATDVADLLFNHRHSKGHSSPTHGYTTGGSHAPGIDANGSESNVIQRFPFASDADAVDWADLSATSRMNTATASSYTHGFTLGGTNVPGVSVNTIDKFPFASQTNATDWADATITKTGGAGCSSATYGYSLGGTQQPSSIIVNVIEKYPYASQTDSVDVNDITLARSGAAGISSCEDAYCVAGVTVGTNPANSAPLWDHTTIDKHSFASGGNSTDHGDLPVQSGAGSHDGGGMSGTTHGYHAGGIYSWNVNNHQYPREQIEKFAYANNVTATDVGDLVDTDSTGIIHWGMNGCSAHQV